MEAKILARLEHPSIVPIHDLGTAPDGAVWYVMKRIDGEGLDRAADPLSLPERLRLFLRICDAVSFAHAHGVIHRDLKPSNVMVGAFGEVLVMDWGIAKILGERNDQSPLAVSAGQGQTGAGRRLGTPGFMAPEQERGEADSIDARTDVFALGAISIA